MLERVIGNRASRATVVVAFAGGLLAAACSAGGADMGSSPDTVYYNANIHTVDPARPRAAALAIRGDRLVAVGSNADVLTLAGPDTRRFDLAGRTVLPGLIDAHAHLSNLGSYGLGLLDLSETRSFDAVVAAVAARVKKARPGEWIRGGRWDHERWPERKLPVHAALSAVSPENPVWLTRVDGHAGLANAAALKLAGITRETPEPAGGDILRDERGDLTGVLIDNAMELVSKHAQGAAGTPAELILKGQEMCLAVGLTGVHDAGASPALIEVYRKLADEGRLKLRVYVMVDGAAAAEYFANQGITIGPRLTVRAAKVYADGALGSRGALLFEPYADKPTDEAGRPYTGLALEMDLLRTLADDGLRVGYQVCTHAIGDRANRETLDIYAAALERAGSTAQKAANNGIASAARTSGQTRAPAGGAAPPRGPRFRIEHAQVLHPDDIPRFARLGVIPAMQATHCTSDMRWVEARLGPRRAAGAYAWASVLRAGARIANGSDFPVESENPMLGLYAAITRQDVQGQPAGGWRAQERMTRTEALRSFTLDAAYAAFEEDQRGSLAGGKLADFIVLDRDVMTCPPEEIPQARVLLTVVGGERVYEAR
ncbi:MAG: amidohydrolase [Planctomycetota bacterium]